MTHLDSLADLGTSNDDIVDAKLVEGAGILDILEGCLQVLELGLDLGSGRLCLLDLFEGKNQADREKSQHLIHLNVTQDSSLRLPAPELHR